MKSFKDWKLDELREKFGLKKAAKTFPLLMELLNVPALTDSATKAQLHLLAEKLEENEETWNEEELKMLFISFLLGMVEFKGEGYRLFFDRSHSATIGATELHGVVDAMVAAGSQDPKQPFFFIHEYKPDGTRSAKDPKAQLLSAMVAAHAQNEDKNFPIFGCYILGRVWFFCILKDKTFSFSRAFDATETEDIEKIFQVLKNVKQKIEVHLAQKPLTSMLTSDD